MRNAPPALLAAALGLAVLIACSPQPAAGPDAETTARIDSLQASLATLENDKLAAAKPHADAGPAVYFVNLKDGDTVTSPVRVVFGLYGMGIAPALIEKENTGHHHLLVDTEIPAEEMEFAIPNDPQHIHFGGGQTETVVELTPGQHTLKLVFADLNHTPLNPSIESPTITINVQ
jgi:hypothetical protein